MFSKEIVVDNTKRSCAGRCKRKFQLRHMLGLQSQYGSTALRAGSCWHGFMEGFYGGIKQFGWDAREKAIVLAIEKGKQVWDAETNGYIFYDDYRSFENVSDMFISYIQHYQADENFLEVMDVEQVFELPIELVTAEEVKLFGHLPTIIFTGRIDLTLTLSGSMWAKEHKTTGFTLDVMANQLNKSMQVIGYSYAAKHILPYKIDGFLVSFAYWISRKTKDGSYGKLTTDFRRVPQVYNDGDLEAWKRAFLYECDQIYRCFENDYFPMQYDACYDYGKSCSFKPLCDTHIPVKDLDWESAGYVYAPWDVRSEVEG